MAVRQEGEYRMTAKTDKTAAGTKNKWSSGGAGDRM